MIPRMTLKGRQGRDKIELFHAQCMCVSLAERHFGKSLTLREAFEEFKKEILYFSHFD